MGDPEGDRVARAALRRRDAARWPLRAFPLGGEPLVDPLDATTIDDRVAVMWPLARAAWAVAGLTIPAYERRESPGRILRASP
jgi:hypothetical protein